MMRIHRGSRWSGAAWPLVGCPQDGLLIIVPRSGYPNHMLANLAARTAARQQSSCWADNGIPANVDHAKRERAGLQLIAAAKGAQVHFTRRITWQHNRSST
jgi:hypothetical protein